MRLCGFDAGLNQPLFLIAGSAYLVAAASAIHGSASSPACSTTCSTASSPARRPSVTTAS